MHLFKRDRNLILVSMRSVQSLPRSVGKLKRLSNFNCDRNQLTSLPKEVSLSPINRHHFIFSPVANLSEPHSAKDVALTSAPRPRVEV